MSDIPIKQNTLNIAIRDKFPNNPGLDNPSRIVRVREIKFSSLDLTEEYLCIFVDGQEKGCVKIGG